METAMKQPLNWLHPQHWLQGINRLASKIGMEIANIKKNKTTNKQKPTTDQKSCIKVCLNGHYTSVLILEIENLWKVFPV